MQIRNVLIFGVLAFLFIPVASAQVNGVIYGDGYTLSDKIVVENGTFVSFSETYTGQNFISVKGDIENLTVKIQSSNDNFTTLKTDRTIKDISGDAEVKFKPLQGNQYRVVFEADKKNVINSVTVERKLSLIRPATIAAGTFAIFIIIGIGSYIVVERI